MDHHSRPQRPTFLHTTPHRWLFLALVFFVIALARHQLSAAQPHSLKLAVNPWLGSMLNGQVAKILLEEQLGYRVELVPFDEYAQFPALAAGELSATLEVWPSGHAEDRRIYLEQQKTVEDLGPLGVVGKIGWFVPTYLLESEPSLATWQGIKAHSGLFKTAATGDHGQLLEGDPTWIYRDQQIIDDLGLDLKIVQAGTETGLVAAVEAAYARHDPILFYFWTPHSIHQKLQLTEVMLPAITEGCRGCEYPSEILYKAADAGLDESAPAAHRFLKNMHYGNEDQIAMMADVEVNGKTAEAAARAWINQHEAAWSAWLQMAGQDFPPIPPPANTWAAQNLYVLDKDTNGVFVNANSLFWQSLRPAFPEIQSVADLAGRDDYYFYPADLANQFRADDRRVLTAGVPLVTVEVNEPVGGPRTVVRVTKVPLRDSRDRIIGLRAIWHSQPQLLATLVPEGVQITVPGTGGIFRLERRDDLSSASAWVPLAISSNAAAGPSTLTFPATGAQGYFRMVADQPVTIGALLSITGDWSSLGKNCQAALQAGMEAINLEQLSSGSPMRFGVEVRDTQLIPATALTQLESLARAGVKVVIGPQSSAELRVLKPFADANGILLISPSSTASSLALTNDNLFRFCPDDTYEAEAMVALLRADGIEAIVPIWRDDAGNQGLHDSTARLFAAQGGTVYPGVKYSAEETEFSAELAELSAQLTVALTNPARAAIYLAGFDEVAEIFDLARTNLTLASVPWYGSDGVVQSQVLASNLPAARFASEHQYPCPTFGLDDRYRTIWEPVATLLKSRTGNDVDAFTLAAYDAFQVSVQAYRKVGPEPASAALRAAFIESASNYTGATGPTLLNAAGDRAGGAFDFWSLKNGPSGYVWYRSGAFQPQAGGNGIIVRFP